MSFWGEYPIRRGRTLKINLTAADTSPLVENVRRLEDAGVAAVVMYSLFADQLEGECDHRCPVRSAYERSNYLRPLQLGRT